MTDDKAPQPPSPLHRRDFLAGTAAVVVGGAAVAVNSTPALASEQATARIVQLEHSGATTGTTTLDDEVVSQLIEKALMRFAGAATGVEALRKYFDPTQKIGIKINTLGSPYSAVNPITAFTLARLLEEMGAPKTNIRIYDQYQTRMRKAGYRLRRPEDGVWVTKHLGRAPERQVYEKNGRRVEFHWDQTATWPDAVINVCIPKDHDLTGVTGALKNMAMGNVEPTSERAANTANPGHYTVVPRFHTNNCDPAIPWLYSQPMIKGKVKLIVADALRVLYHGGPQDKPRFRKRLNQIWVATDPVAVDSTILRLVNGIRQEKGMKPVEEDLFRNKPRLPHYIATAADEYGLGVRDAAHITLDHEVIG